MATIEDINEINKMLDTITHPVLAPIFSEYDDDHDLMKLIKNLINAKYKDAILNDARNELMQRKNELLEKEKLKMSIDVDKLLTIIKAMHEASEAIKILLRKDTKEDVCLNNNEFYIKLNGVIICNWRLNDICRSILIKKFNIELLDVFFEAIYILHNEMDQLLLSEKIKDISFFVDGKETDINQFSTAHKQEK